MSENTEAVELKSFDGTEMLAEVADYFQGLRQAQRDYDEANADARYAWGKAERAAKIRWEDDPAARQDMTYWDAYARRRNDAALREAYDAYQQANGANTNALNTARTAARQNLKDSKNSYVTWIEANALDSEEGYSHIILKALPVENPEDLWELKREHGMCREFDRLYAAAETDGAFNNGKKAPGARELAALRNRIARTWGESYSRELMTYMGPYLKSVRAEMDAQLLEAKAEWQKLDEARAEQTARNRSEGARRAAETRRRNAEEQASGADRLAMAVQAAEDNPGTDVADRLTKPTAQDVASNALRESLNRATTTVAV